MKPILQILFSLTVAAVIVSCGDSSSSSSQMPDPATQPEAQAAIFQRTADRVKSLIAAKDYKQAQETLNSLKSYKLTPDQQKIADQFQAQIPKTN